MNAFDLTPYLHTEEHLLLVVSNSTMLTRIMHLSALLQNQIGFISDSFPLLSNLDVLENITLGSMYRHNISLKKARRIIEQEIRALHLESLLHKRKELLTREELVRVHFARCLATDNSVILLESPTVFSLEIVFECLRSVDRRIRIWVSCHHSDKLSYRGYPLRETAIGE
jgi:ABC-type lipoprotein export system ATPase subunit